MRLTRRSWDGRRFTAPRFLLRGASPRQRSTEVRRPKGCVANSSDKTGRPCLVFFSPAVHAGASNVVRRPRCYQISICNRSLSRTSAARRSAHGGGAPTIIVSGLLPIRCTPRSSATADGSGESFLGITAGTLPSSNLAGSFFSLVGLRHELRVRHDNEHTVQLPTQLPTHKDIFSVGSLLFRIALSQRATACDPGEVQHFLWHEMLSVAFIVP